MTIKLLAANLRNYYGEPIAWPMGDAMRQAIERLKDAGTAMPSVGGCPIQPSHCLPGDDASTILETSQCPSS